MPETPLKLDTTGAVCPIPAAETRKKLRGMKPGQVLEVTGDFDCAAENIKNIAEKNGGQVLGVETGNNFFKVVIKKI
jgi:TusA-related sulfurtransferase